MILILPFNSGSEDRNSVDVECHYKVSGCCNTSWECGAKVFSGKVDLAFQTHSAYLHVNQASLGRRVPKSMNYRSGVL